ncbi:MAG: hypothetical protein JWM95_1795 [Gemmatimonadetes bacterium]|nr:hypothetical protein [Gemmatimonadota bacterium]
MSIRPLLTIAALGCIVSITSDLSAQTTSGTSGWEFLMTSGAVVPTGHQRDAIKTGKLSAAQVTYVVQPALAVTATMGWARTNDIASAGDPTLDVFTYDVSAELRGTRWNDGGDVTFRPFAGGGAGARSYNYRNLDVDATHNAAAYGSLGGDLGIRRVQLRIEARDYVTGFKPLAGVGAPDTRNDVVMMVGVRIATR